MDLTLQKIALMKLTPLIYLIVVFYPIIITSSKLFTAQFLQTIMKQKYILRRRKNF